MTIAQAADKRKVDKKWARETLEKIKATFNSNSTQIASFIVDCIYWIRRTENTPFYIEQAFPLGSRYPSIAINLNQADLTNDNSLLKFMHDRDLITSEEIYEKFEDLAYKVLDSVAKAIKSLAAGELKSVQNSGNSQIRFEWKHNSTYYGLLMCGSFMHGVKYSDLDIGLVINDATLRRDELSSSLAYELAQEDGLFHLVRNIDDANVPIIELCLKSESVEVCEGADVQIHHCNELGSLDEYLFYDSVEFMKRLDVKLNDYAKLFPIAGIFENQNMKKYMKNYKVNP